MNKMKKLSISVITLVILCLCLCITSFALGMTVYEVKNNSFQTGGIEIDLNGGKPIITADEFLFEPGKRFLHSEQWHLGRVLQIVLLSGLRQFG